MDVACPYGPSRTGYLPTDKTYEYVLSLGVSTSVGVVLGYVFNVLANRFECCRCCLAAVFSLTWVEVTMHLPAGYTSTKGWGTVVITQHAVERRDQQSAVYQSPADGTISSRRQSPPRDRSAFDLD